ncbi:hypothetical protein ACHAXA_011884, partial [Cyclostephanos tholiformis]
GRTWTPEEDEIVIRAVLSEPTNAIPFQRWSELATRLPPPGRTGKMVRDRWTNNLDPRIDKSPFSKEDDDELFRAHGIYGKRWVEISERVYHSRRSENQVKNRWNSAAFKAFVSAEYGIDAYKMANRECGPSRRLGRLPRPQSSSPKVSSSRRRIRRTPPMPALALSSGAPQPPVPVATTITPSPPANVAVVPTTRVTNEEEPLVIATMTSAPARDANRPSPLSLLHFLCGRKDPGNEYRMDDLSPRSINNGSRPSQKGRAYTVEEDEMISRAALAERDFTQWAALASSINAMFYPSLLPKRSGKQIRDRWVNYLNPALNRRPWSREEDVRLWRAHEELGKRWTIIGIEKFHTTRSENQIKNRWNSAAFRKFVKDEYGKVV